MFHLRLPQLLLALAAVAIIATGIVYTADRPAKVKASRCALVDAYVRNGVRFCPVPPTCETFAPCTDINTNQVACTADAKQCPDGSYVSRVPPSCEFAACPAGNVNTNASGSILLGEYNYREISSDPLCGKLEITKRDSGAVLSTLRICEDNVESFTTQNGVITLTTQCGRQYTRTVATGEENVTTPSRCTGIGGLSILD